jgi:transposase
MSGILYRLRTGCQWDAIPSEFGSRSTCYRRFVEWTQQGVFRMMHVEMLLYYDEERGIEWARASLDSASVKAPNSLGDESDTLHGARTYGLRADCVPRGNAKKRTRFLIVAVAVAVSVALAARVMVAALVSGNHIVELIDAARRLWIDDFREHGHDALAQVDAALLQLAFDQHRWRGLESAALARPQGGGALNTARVSFPLTSAATSPGATTSPRATTSTSTPPTSHTTGFDHPFLARERELPSPLTLTTKQKSFGASLASWRLVC